MAYKKLLVTDIVLKQFRCFPEKHIVIDGLMFCLEGDNGTGKSSLLEALHYACYLRSFRTSQPRDLISFGADAFFLQITLLVDDEPHLLQIGVSRTERVVKFDKRKVSSYKELIDYYRVISITENDMNIVMGSPDNRRDFVDQALSIQDPEMIAILKELHVIVANRTRLFYAEWSFEHYRIWTDQLIQVSSIVRKKRQEYLSWLSARVLALGKEYIGVDFCFSIDYKEAGKEFMIVSHDDYEYIMYNERRLKRSLLGAHIDDFLITFGNKTTKRFASRGQQKLIVVLLKIAQLQYIAEHFGPPLLLLDDCFSDFDEKIKKSILNLIIQMNVQVVIASPKAQDELFLPASPGFSQRLNLSV